MPKALLEDQVYEYFLAHLERRIACLHHSHGSISSRRRERLPRWVHRPLPRFAPPAAREALRSARVPSVDYLDKPIMTKKEPVLIVARGSVLSVA
jgi:hypothetical protein